jgi:hypothetical protein
VTAVEGGARRRAVASTLRGFASPYGLEALVECGVMSTGPLLPGGVVVGQLGALLEHLRRSGEDGSRTGHDSCIPILRRS